MSLIHLISLGAGVQSSTMALMASHGEITPMPHAAIFADTQAEPASVYRWLDWLEPKLAFPVHRVSAGNLWKDSTRVRKAKAGHAYVRPMIPAFTRFGSGEKGMWWRKCTAEYKLVPIMREVRRLRKMLGKPKVVQWVGISLDEAHRMKPAREKYVESRWPLIDARMSRTDCLRWMETKGYPRPPRSACVFCPFHSDSEWLSLKRTEPQEFNRAAEYEAELREVASKYETTRGVPFLHSSLVPLSEVAFDHEKQLDLFGNECEGMCGV